MAVLVPEATHSPLLFYVPIIGSTKNYLPSFVNQGILSDEVVGEEGYRGAKDVAQRML